jgi:2-polyprenyl-3-methyl-5-hydroxy-6-metoxy-1,4-benzoquinol methylase
MNLAQCPLCNDSQIIDFHRDKKRDYWRCTNCYLVFVNSDQQIDLEAEKAIYDLHQNQPNDLGYRQFLSRLAEPLLAQLKSPKNGLDFGCGPGPVLAEMLTEAGHTMTVFDLFYANHPERLDSVYDFITCTEVVEHFRNPQREFQRLFSLLKPQGHLAIMTKLVIDAEAFGRWHYKNDQTHISFFSRETLQWLAKHYQAELNFFANDVAIFKLLD